MTQPYLTYTEWTQLGIRPKSLHDIGVGDIGPLILARSAYADGFIRKRYTLPLQTSPQGWNEDLKMNLAWLITCDALTTFTSWNPDRGGDKVIADRCAMAEEWLLDVSTGAIDPGFTDADPEAAEDEPILTTNVRQDWLIDPDPVTL